MNANRIEIVFRSNDRKVFNVKFKVSAIQLITISFNFCYSDVSKIQLPRSNLASPSASIVALKFQLDSKICLITANNHESMTGLRVGFPSPKDK